MRVSQQSVVDCAQVTFMAIDTIDVAAQVAVVVVSCRLTMLSAR